jgi:hypothetical protein
MVILTLISSFILRTSSRLVNLLSPAWSVFEGLEAIAYIRNRLTMAGPRNSPLTPPPDALANFAPTQQFVKYLWLYRPLAQIRYLPLVV